MNAHIPKIIVVLLVLIASVFTGCSSKQPPRILEWSDTAGVDVSEGSYDTGIVILSGDTTKPVAAVSKTMSNGILHVFVKADETPNAKGVNHFDAQLIITPDIKKVVFGKGEHLIWNRP